MNRYFAPLLLILTLAACSSTTAPTDSVPTVAMTREASDCAITQVFRGDGYEYQVGNEWRWHVTDRFYMACPGGDIRVKLFFINVDGTRELFGTGPVTGLHFDIDGKAPSFNLSDVMELEHEFWFPRFDAEDSRNGEPIGTYRFSTRVQLIPNVPRGHTANREQ
jgi:hypothetical protein